MHLKDVYVLFHTYTPIKDLPHLILTDYTTKSNLVAVHQGHARPFVLADRRKRAYPFYIYAHIRAVICLRTTSK